MELMDELLPGAFRFQLNRLTDLRGHFVKTYSCSAFGSAGVAFESKEEYYTLSGKNVIRGMHFQLPPYDHDKIVTCIQGEALDVLLDLRTGNGYGACCAISLSAEDPCLIFVPRGVAHGFASLRAGTIMSYKTSSEYAPAHDAGVRWDSFGFDWKLDAPILSDRDTRHPPLGEFTSPF